MPSKKSVWLLLVAIFFTMVFHADAVLGVENKPAFRISSSASTYNYFIPLDKCNADPSEPPSGQEFRYKQASSLAYSVDMVRIESKDLGIYFTQGVDFRILTQDDQTTCDGGGNLVSAAVPEKAFLYLSEVYGTVGKRFGFLTLEIALGYVDVKGNYYYNHERSAREESFLLLRLNSEAQLEFGDRIQVGVRVSWTSQGPHSDSYYSQHGFMEYLDSSMFFRVFL